MEDKLVTIAQFENYIEAELAKQQLADFGITAAVTGANAANTYSGFLFVEGPELQVFASRAKEAMDILESSKEQVQVLGEEEEEQ
ncbi:MAG: DUF2007 domain-containing protein [Phycisphaerae bacterium]|nr:DUF2007 domain-containing protein [Phycisphaerae bacterium]